MSGLNRSHSKAKHSPVNKKAGTPLNAHTSRANAQKKRSALASAAKAAQVAKRRTKKAAAKK